MNSGLQCSHKENMKMLLCRQPHDMAEATAVARALYHKLPAGAQLQHYYLRQTAMLVLVRRYMRSVTTTAEHAWRRVCGPRAMRPCTPWKMIRQSIVASIVSGP